MFKEIKGRKLKMGVQSHDVLLVFVPEDIDEAKHYQIPFHVYVQNKINTVIRDLFKLEDRVYFEAVLFGITTRIQFEKSVQQVWKSNLEFHEWTKGYYKYLVRNEIDRYMYPTFDEFLKFLLISGGVFFRFAVNEDEHPRVETRVTRTVFQDNYVTPVEVFIQRAAEIHKMHSELDKKYFGLTADRVNMLLSDMFLK